MTERPYKKSLSTIERVLIKGYQRGGGANGGETPEETGGLEGWSPPNIEIFLNSFKS